MKISILYSGGLDSLMMYHYAKVKHPDAEVECVYWDHGHAARQSEMEHLPSFVKVRKVDWLNLPVDGGYLAKETEPASGAMYIPGRNLVFSVLTACQGLADEVWVGALLEEAHEHASDKNYEFFEKSTAVLSHVLGPWKERVVVRAPFVDEKWSKFDALKWCLENGLAQEDVIDTYSCYNLEGSSSFKKCGNCKQCVRRLLIFHKLGFDELFDLVGHPLSMPKSRAWVIEIIDALEAVDWKGPLVAEVPQYFDVLPEIVRRRFYLDHELVRVAQLVEKRMPR